MSEQQHNRSEESLRHEYAEVAQNVRHYSNLRFAVFSIFFAVIGGVGFVAYGKGQFDAHTAVVARIAGVLVITIFWLYEERLSEFANHYYDSAIELERALGYKQYLSWPLSRGHFPGTHVTWRVFFVGVVLLWFYSAIAVPLK